jgi:hypothetical protein
MHFVSVVIREVNDVVVEEKCKPAISPATEPLPGVMSVNIAQYVPAEPATSHSKETQIPPTPHGGFATVVIQDNNQLVEKEKCQSEVLPTPEPNRGVMAVGISSLTGTKLPKTNRSKETKIPPQPQRGVSHVWIKDS